MRKCRFVLGILAIIFFVGCNDQNPVVSEGIFGKDKMMVLKDSIVASIEAYTVSDADAITSPVTSGFAGVHNDNIFGKTSSGIAFQFRTPRKYVFEEEVEGVQITEADLSVDSAFLYLAYDKVYFDSTQIQNLNVYQIQGAGLDFTRKYRANERNIELADLEKITEEDFNYEILADSTIVKTTLNIKSKINPELDSVRIDTLISSHLKIALPNDYAKRVFIDDATPENYMGQKEFLEYFKGIYLDVDDISNEGALYAFNISKGLTTSSGSSTRRTTLEVNYSYEHYFESIEKDSTVLRSIGFYTNENSSRVNFITNDFTGSEIGSVIGDKGDVPESDLVYVKGLAGTNVKLYIDEINNWKDSLDVAINKADLVLTAEKDSAYNAEHPVPEKLNLAIFEETDEENAGPIKIADAIFDKVNNSYTFNLSLYLQKIIQDKGTTLNKGFLVYASNRREDPRRVILANPKEAASDKDKRIKLSITYTKIK